MIVRRREYRFEVVGKVRATNALMPDLLYVSQMSLV